MILTRHTGQITTETLSFLEVAPATAQAKNEVIQLPSSGISLEQVQVSLVRQALNLSGNNQTTAAKLLGISRSKFRVMLKNTNGDQSNE